MPVIFNHYPYNDEEYKKNFINIPVLLSIHKFCMSNNLIKAVYAKGSIIHGCMIPGSDIDHMRIQTTRQLTLKEKIQLVGELENSLKKLGVSEIKRIREDDYARVFFQWKELKNLPRANNIQYELWPRLNILNAKNKTDWFHKIIALGLSYTGFVSEDWIREMRRRICNEI